MFWQLVLLPNGQQLPSPTDPLSEIETLLDQGRFLAALDACRALPYPSPEPERLNRLLGKTHYGLVNFDSAAYYFQGAREGWEKKAGNSRQFHTERQLAGCDLALALSALRQRGEAEQLVRSALSQLSEARRPEQPAKAYACYVLATCLARQGKLKEALTQIEHGESIHHTIRDTASVQFAGIAGLKGYLLWRTAQDLAEAARHMETAGAIYRRYGGPTSDYLGPLGINLGGCYDDQGLSGKALPHYENALTVLQAQNHNHPLFPSLYNNLGNTYKNLGEYTLAIRYLEEAVRLNPTNGRYHNNLGDAYLESGDARAAEGHFRRALELLSGNASSSPEELARPYHNLAIILRLRGDYRQALEFEKQSLPYRKAKWGMDHLDVARTYLGLGETYTALNQPAGALAHLDTALWIQRRLVPAGRHPEIAAVFLIKAEIAEAAGDEQSVLRFVDSALFAAGYRENNTTSVLAWQEFLEGMSRKAASLLRRYSQEKRPADLKQAFSLYQTAAEFLHPLRLSLLESESKTLVTARFSPIFESLIRTGLLMHRDWPDTPVDLAGLFDWAERGKAYVLLEGLRESNARQFAGLPAGKLDEERRIRTGINRLESERDRMLVKGIKPDDKDLLTLQNQLFREQAAYTSLKKELESTSPAYYRLKYGIETISASEVRRSLLQPDQALLEYMVGEHSVFLFLLSPDRFLIREIPLDFPLEQWVRQMRQGIYGYYGAREKTDALRREAPLQYVEAATGLYQKLIAPVAAFLPEKVIVAPDGILGYLPFEALLTEPPAVVARTNTYRYLLAEHAISYCYSATLLREIRQKPPRKSPPEPFLAFAPFYDDDTDELALHIPGAVDVRRGFDPLPFSGEEALGSRDLMGGQVFLGTAATETQFIRSAGQARILHLATHGEANDRVGDYCFLAFSPLKDSTENELVYVRDIYNLELNAELVVLSACETGIGEIKKGEGIISLARAFAYAGAASIVTSLWSVKDDKTKDLMLAFYGHIKDGTAIDEALRKAKLDMIRGNRAGEAGHPFFWAGFIAIGDMKPLPE